MRKILMIVATFAILTGCTKPAMEVELPQVETPVVQESEVKEPTPEAPEETPETPVETPEVPEEVSENTESTKEDQENSLFDFDCELLNGIDKPMEGCLLKGFKVDIVVNGEIPEEITIPATHNGEPVIKIGPYAFQNLGLTKVDFSKAKNLEFIGEHSFEGNKLTEVDFNGANRLYSILGYSFSNNEIVELKFNNPRLSIISSYAFHNNKMKTLDLTGIPNLTHILEYAFSKNYLVKIDMTGLEKIAYDFNTMDTMDMYAFWDNGPNKNGSGIAWDPAVDIWVYDEQSNDWYDINWGN